jgi:hypothetical protein
LFYGCLIKYYHQVSICVKLHLQSHQAYIRDSFQLVISEVVGDGLNLPPHRALWDLFSLAVLSGNAAWPGSFLVRERGEEGEWDEWEGGGRPQKVTNKNTEKCPKWFRNL